MIVHTDEVGFVVSGVRDDGALYLTAVGGWDLAALGGRQVDVHLGPGRSVPGVVITVPPHLDRGLGSPPAWLEGDQVVVDVGVDDAAGVAALGVEVLQPVTLARRHAVLPGGPIVARGLDNRFGCYLLLGLARRLAVEPPPGAQVSLAWASQEEVGFRGTAGARAAGSLRRRDCGGRLPGRPTSRRPRRRYRRALGSGARGARRRPHRRRQRGLPGRAGGASGRPRDPGAAGVRPRPQPSLGVPDRGRHRARPADRLPARGGRVAAPRRPRGRRRAPAGRPSHPAPEVLWTR